MVSPTVYYFPPHAALWWDRVFGVIFVFCHRVALLYLSVSLLLFWLATVVMSICYWQNISCFFPELKGGVQVTVRTKSLKRSLILKMEFVLLPQSLHFQTKFRLCMSTCLRRKRSSCIWESFCTLGTWFDFVKVNTPKCIISSSLSNCRAILSYIGLDLQIIFQLFQFLNIVPDTF